MTAPPAVVVVGAACRDLDRTDRRGWRLGGAVAYAGLTLARLGVRTAALIGADREAARAPELDLLRQAGVEVELHLLDRGAVFENIETLHGRVQSAFSQSEEVPPSALPHAWRVADPWLFAPVAGELPDTWADVPPAEAFVGLGWQGLLRTLEPGQPVGIVPPHPSALLRRADLISVGADDLAADTDLGALGELVHPGASVLLTRSAAGGLLLVEADGMLLPARRYPAVPADPRDPTGAGDVFLAALLAARLGRGTEGVRRGAPTPEDLRFAATVAGLAVEGVGLNGVPDASAVGRRLRAHLVARRG